MPRTPGRHAQKRGQPRNRKSAPAPAHSTAGRLAGEGGHAGSAMRYALPSGCDRRTHVIDNAGRGRSPARRRAHTQELKRTNHGCRPRRATGSVPGLSVGTVGGPGRCILAQHPLRASSGHALKAAGHSRAGPIRLAYGRTRPPPLFTRRGGTRMVFSPAAAASGCGSGAACCAGGSGRVGPSAGAMP